MTDRTPSPHGDTAPWTPNQKLRADATDEQINARSQRLVQTLDPAMNFTVLPLMVAREFADACVAAENRRCSEIAMRNRDVFGYNCDCHDEIERGECLCPFPPDAVASSCAAAPAQEPVAVCKTCGEKLD